MKKNIVLLSACLLLCSLCGCRFDAAEQTQAAAPMTAVTTLTDADIAAQAALSMSETAWSTMPASEPVPETTDSPPERQTAVSVCEAAETDAPSVVPSQTNPQTTITTTAAGTDASSAATRKSLLQQLRDNLQSGTRKKDPAFFDNAVFIGDSVTMGLKNYTNGRRNKGEACLGSAQFLTCGSMGYTNTLGKVGSDSMHPTYKGSKVTVENGIALCGAGKAMIMLGMNDFSAYGEKTWKNSVTTLLDRIENECPDVDIYLESVTPILNGMEHGRFSNENVRAFNDYLQTVCNERGYTFIDIYDVLADESGHLRQEYCGDPGAMGIHMSNSGSAAWAQYLQDTFCGDDSE